jgi:Protein of unknown function (DUF1552)
MSFVTRRHLSRRTVLRALGASIALPWLDAMQPAFAGAAPAAPPVRLAFVYIPNGVIPAQWTPAGEGRDFTLSRILKPLEPYREDLLVLSGLAHRNADPLGDGAGDHARAGACYLTGVHPRKTAGADIHNAVSTDQIAAQALGSHTRLPSLELGCEDSRTVGSCDSGYSCSYTNTISWRGPTSPLPAETNPRAVFERLFGADDVLLDPAARARRARDRTSVLDLVRDRSQALASRLGPSDRRKLDEHLYAVREMERQITRAENDDSQIVPPIEKPTGIPPSFADYVRLMVDLQVMAFQSDLTRIGTLMLGREGSLRSYPEIGVPDSHHPLTHHRGQPQFVESVAKINTYHAELFGYFIARLKATADGDATLFDRSMVVYGGAIADGDKHTHTDLPVLVTGAGGGLKGGRHVRYAPGTPMTNLYVSLLERMGAPVAAIGDSTGHLPGLDGLDLPLAG